MTPRLLVALLVLSGVLQAQAIDPPAPGTGLQVVVTPRELVDEPVSPLIYGNFIESGIGREVEGLWAEMLFNRSFESVPPYTAADYGSRGCGPEADLTQELWWHSGYEEAAWELMPGNQDARFDTPDHVGFWRGQRAAWLRNESEDRWAGFGQRGIHLRAGEDYVVSGFFRTGRHEWDTDPDDLSLDAELRIYAEGDLTEPVFAHALDDVRKAYDRRTWTFHDPDFTGRAVFSVWTPPGSVLGADALSLMPASNLDGWRADAVAATRRVRPRILRWPGGCFASFYHWRGGIGARSERSESPSWFWGGLYDNDVGTSEFVRFCRLVDAEPLICVNVLSGDADEAADWVAYCNAPTDHPVGRLRARDGHPAPLDVRYWELDNETGRRFTTVQYAERCVEYARAMRAIDPTIRIAADGYDWHRLELGKLLDIAGEHIDFVVDRAIDETALRNDLDEIRAYNQRSGRHVRLCNTEWPAPVDDVPAAADRAELEKIDTDQGRRRCWYSALNVARTLLTFQRLGGDFAFADFNDLANTWGQNVIECTKEGAWLAPAGEVFELFSRSPAAWPLELQVVAPREGVTVQAAWNADRSALCVYAINTGAEAVPLTFALGDLGRRFARCEVTSLRAPSPTSCNTPVERSVVEHEESTIELQDPARLTLEVGPFEILQGVLPAEG